MLNTNNHLRQWLDSAVRVCTGKELDESWCITERCKIVGQHILSLDQKATIEDVQQELHAIYGTSCVSNDISIIDFLLVHAVSEDCQGRCEFLEGIMNLEDEAQLYLMQVIQDHHCRANSDQNESVVVDTPTSLAGALSVSAYHLERNIRTLDYCSDTCTACIDKDALVKRLQQEVKFLITTSGDEIRRLKEESGVQASQVYDLDQDLLEKQRIIFENNILLKEAEEVKVKYEQMVERNENLERLMLELQDEVDVASSLTAKLDVAEGQVERLRAKLEELVDIKQQLTKESASHSATHDKLLVAERDVNELRKYKVQVEQYRAHLAETSIETEELKTRLQGSQGETIALREEIATLRGDQPELRRQIQSLEEEIRVTAEQLRGKGSIFGIGEGMSELNPALMQELNRLKSENRDLFEKLDQSEVDKLESLRKEIADTTCMNESLTKKWIATKDALVEAERETNSLSHRLHDKEAECLTLRVQIAEQSRMHEEDTFTCALQHSNELAVLRRQHRDVLGLMHQGHDAVLCVYDDSLSKAHTCAEQHQQQVEELTVLQAHTAQSLAVAQKEYKWKELERKAVVYELKMEFSVISECATKKHQAELTQLQEESQQVLAAQQQEMQQTLKRVQSEAQLVVAEAHQKTADQAALFKKESKRRHAAEAEVQRLKGQLLSATTVYSGNEGVKMAHQAMTEMRQELKEACATISALQHNSSATDQLVTMPMDRSRAHRELNADCLRCAGYAEQAFVDKKKMEQLIDEKRELIVRNLLEQVAHHEAVQQLLVLESRKVSFETELRRVTLDSERIERNLSKQLESLAEKLVLNKQNV